MALPWPSTPAAAAAAVAALAVALPAAGCGGSGGGSGGGGGGYGGGGSSANSGDSSAGAPGAKLALKASESGGLSFDHATLSAKAGKVTLTLANPSGNGLPHAIAIEGNGLDRDGATAQPGGTSSVTATLRAGTYTFYCPVDGHRSQGMEGKLIVK
jgi:plastocyanin